MENLSKSHSESELLALAVFLDQQSEEIVAEWLEVIRNDSRIAATERLSQAALEDHIPRLLKDLIASLRSPKSKGETSHQEVQDANAHGLHRSHQGYQLEELLWELTQLRSVVFRRIRSRDVHLAEQWLAADFIQSFLDELAWRSLRVYVGDQQAQLQKLSDSRLRLMRTVSHELRNTLNGLSLSQQMLRDNQAEDLPILREMLGRNIQHMKELLDDVSELSTLASGPIAPKISTLSVKHFVQDVWATYEPVAAAKGLLLRTKIDPGLETVSTDPLKLKQVAANLVSNAVKYTPEGEVILEANAVDSKTWSLAVSDTGVGIAKSEHERIFAELYRVESTAGAPGLGLGLSIVRQLVELLDGTIRVTSEPGVGSRFEILFQR